MVDSRRKRQSPSSIDIGDDEGNLNPILKLSCDFLFDLKSGAGKLLDVARCNKFEGKKPLERFAFDFK